MFMQYYLFDLKIKFMNNLWFSLYKKHIYESLILA